MVSRRKLHEVVELSLEATGEFGLVIRRQALVERGIASSSIVALLEGSNLLGQDEHLLSIGPFFSGGALDVCRNYLQERWFEYGEAFIELKVDLPNWIRAGVAHAADSSDALEVLTLAHAGAPTR